MIARGARGAPLPSLLAGGPEGRAAAGTALARYEFTLPEADSSPSAPAPPAAGSGKARATARSSPCERPARRRSTSLSRSSAIARTEGSCSRSTGPAAGGTPSPSTSRVAPGLMAIHPSIGGALGDPRDRPRAARARPHHTGGRTATGNPVGTDLAAEDATDGAGEVLMPFPWRHLLHGRCSDIDRPAY